jgi:hypothetical protein
VVVAVTIVRVMQSACDEIIHMIPVGNGGMPAIGTVNMLLRVSRRCGRAVIGMLRVHFDFVLVHMRSMNVVKMTVMKIVGMPIMFDRDMTAARSMLMRVIFVFHAIAHTSFSFHVVNFVRRQKLKPASRLCKRRFDENSTTVATGVARLASTGFLSGQSQLPAGLRDGDLSKRNEDGVYKSVSQSS